MGHGGSVHARRVAFWLMQPQSDIADDSDVIVDVSIQKFVKLSEMVEAKELNSTAAKEVLSEMLRSGNDPVMIATEKNLLQESDEGAITKIVEQVVSENPKAAEDVKNGEMKAIGFLVGQVMKLSQGKANPQMAGDLIKKQLGL
jgi:aspartyl-tRNA(Asn)/glutamyl-tRNA(Gln) amidotransferase subunit B